MPFDSEERSPCRDCHVHQSGKSKLKRFDPENAYYETSGQHVPKPTGKLIDECYDCELRMAFLSVGVATTLNQRPFYGLRGAKLGQALTVGRP